MNRFLAVMAICGGIVLVAVLPQLVNAQSAEDNLTEEHIERIRDNCVSAQSALGQLHVSDALLRNNRGQLYEQISSKLMAPLNSRIALNRMGGLKLATTALEYDQRFSSFSSSYQQYEISMSQTLKINCLEQPQKFYNAVTATREKRQKLHSDVTQLNALLQTYKTEFEAFVKDSGKEGK